MNDMMYPQIIISYWAFGVKMALRIGRPDDGT